MTSALTPFTFPATGQAVRTVLGDNGPGFVLGDVCAVLGLTNVTEARRGLDEDEFRTTEVMDSLGREQQTYIVTEAGLYSLILRSRKPEARAFKRWITHEVLPAIRQTGAYTLAPAFEVPRTLPDALRAYATEVEAHEATKQRAAELEAPAEAWNTLATAEGDYSVRQAAQILDRDPNIITGQNRLFASLREFGWIDRKGIPYQEHVDLGRIVQRPTSYTHPHHGEPVLSSQIRITPKGVEALRKLLGGGDDGHLFAVPGGA